MNKRCKHCGLPVEPADEYTNDLTHSPVAPSRYTYFGCYAATGNPEYDGYFAEVCDE